MAARRGRPKKVKSVEDSKSHLKESIGEQSDFLGVNWDNHRIYHSLDNCYSITVKVMSLNLLIKLMEDSRVKQVFYHPSIAPPGSGLGPIALRYKLYVQYK